jgi:uncharacterized glyoxalase superfamily protein PhnB
MIPKLDLIGIATSNMAEALRFYRLLGLEIPDVADGLDHVEVLLPHGLRMAWDDVEMVKGLSPDWEEPRGTRITLAFLCASPREVDEKYREVVESGFDGAKPPWDAFWGQRYAIVKDPDGNSIDLFAPLG